MWGRGSKGRLSAQSVADELNAIAITSSFEVR